MTGQALAWSLGQSLVIRPQSLVIGHQSPLPWLVEDHAAMAGFA